MVRSHRYGFDSGVARDKEKKFEEGGGALSSIARQCLGFNNGKCDFLLVSR
jgi:hypothetical protein